jgi:hypothetical protein
MYGRILFDGGAVNTRHLKHSTVEAFMISIPLDKMSLAEKLEAMEALWADLSQTPADVPVPQWHRDVLKARQESPATWLDWEQAKASLRDMVNTESDSAHDHRDP